MQSDQTVLKPRMGVKEASVYTGISVSTLNKWRMSKTNGPQFLKLGSRVVYSREQLDKWLDEHARSSTSQYGQEGR